MWKKSITLITIAIITSQLAGCAMVSSDELVQLINNGDEVVVEVVLPDGEDEYIEAGTNTNEENENWIQLDQLDTYSECGFRGEFDKLFNINTITSEDGNSKQGCIYTEIIDGKEYQNGNSTLRDACRNKAFINYLAKSEVQNGIADIVQDVYTDVDNGSNCSLNASLNAYFNLMSESEDGSVEDTTYGGSRSLTRAQFYTLVYKAGNKVQDLKFNKLTDSFVKDNMGGGYDAYTPYVKEIADNGYLDVENGSLNSTNINTSISKMEAVYMVVNTYFKDELDKLDNTKIIKGYDAYGYKTGGNLLEKAKVDEDKISDKFENNTLAYMLTHQDKGIDEGMYKAIIVAKNLDLLNGIDTDLYSTITKDESISLLVNAYKAENEVYKHLTYSEYADIKENKVVDEDKDDDITFKNKDADTDANGNLSDNVGNAYTPPTGGNSGGNSYTPPAQTVTPPTQNTQPSTGGNVSVSGGSNKYADSDNYVGQGGKVMENGSTIVKDSTYGLWH